jgi:hypothetical protein
MLKHIIVICAFCVLTSSALADDTARANRLFVAAVKLIQASEAEASVEKKFELVKKAHSNLTTIIDQFPATDLAVKLISGQKIGTVWLTGVSKALDKARAEKERIALKAKAAALQARAAKEREACFSSPSYACVITQALANAKMIEGASSRGWALADIASAQAKAGDVKGAKETITQALVATKMIEDASSRASALAYIASVLAALK